MRDKFLKFLSLVMVVFGLCFTGLALADDLNQPLASESGVFDDIDLDAADLETDQEAGCFIDVIIVASQSFGSATGSRDYCNGLHKMFGFEQSCFTRRYDNQWRARFQHQRRFFGNDYNSLFRSYSDWSDRHLFRGAGVFHQIRFPSKCFGRGGGGPY